MLDAIAALTGAQSAVRGERIQQLWSGYGGLYRVHLVGAAVPSVVVKQVDPPTATSHPRGWNTSRSHARKLRSYDVELAWYRSWSDRCDARCRVASALHLHGAPGSWTFVLEDLDAAGFPQRHRWLDAGAVDQVLRWLAAFHASFMGVEPTGLWPTGTYWHLETRPDELAVMPGGRLREAAAAIDDRLEGGRYRTLVHGDAKVANFCFAADGAVAGVDFQYVGGGCGIRDVAYFLGSCLGSDALDATAGAQIDRYFEHLGRELGERQPALDATAVEAEWRALHPFAWADFERFLAGWSPGHRKLDRYSQRMTAEALGLLG